MLGIEALAKDPRQLSRCLRDLVALSMLPAVWTRYDARQIAESVTEVLVRTIGLDFAYMSLRWRDDRPKICAAWTGDGSAPDQIALIRNKLAAWLEQVPPGDVVTLANPLGTGTARIVFAPVAAGEDAVVVAASSRSDFPSAAERLLLGVTANQAAIAIRRWQAEQGLQQLNETLEQRVSTEIKERMRVEEEARARAEAARERLDFALDAAGAGAWDWDVATDRSAWSQQMYELFGLDPTATTPSLATLLQVVHPEDVPHIRAAVYESQETEFRQEFRIVHPTQGLRWITGIGRFERGLDGRPLHGSGINIDITERKLAEQALHQAKEAAERANAAKSRFLAAASHDLRQPLQALDLQRAVLARRVADSEVLQTVGELGLSTDVMRNTLDALLDLSQLETGAIKAEVDEFELDELFRRIAGEFRSLAGAKHLAFAVVPTAAMVRSDPRLLDRILQNLVSNAVKYTQVGKVLLGGRRHGQKLRIEVWDTGIGIAPDQLEAIFEEFYQIANPARERRLGRGLGLSIVRAAAGLLGHRLDVRSTPGKGVRVRH